VIKAGYANDFPYWRYLISIKSMLDDLELFLFVWLNFETFKNFS